MTVPGPLKTSPLISDWVRFEDGRIQVMTGRVELGQGNLTALLQIAADELDVDPADCSITGGDTLLTPNEGFTSGSLSIAVGGMALRWAASAARHVLLQEAARLLQTSAANLTLRAGRIERAGLDAELDLWRVAETADLRVPVIEHAAPKRPEQRRLVGGTLARVDLLSRVTGHPFVHDLDFEGLLHGRPIHPPSLSATLKTIDLDGLRQRPGIVGVTRDGSFVGVIATDEYQAIRAAEWGRLRAVWSDPGEAPVDAVAAVGGSSEAAEIVHHAGDMAAAVGERFEVTVSRPYLSHASIGPSTACARWNGGHLSVWTQSQGVFPLRAALAQVFGLDETTIDVHHRPGAGCYGHNGADDVALDAALMARSVPGRPVLVTWSRADEFGAAPLGPAMVTTARAMLDADHRIQAMEVTANSPPHGNRPGRSGSPNLRAAAYLERPFPPARSADVPLSSGGGADRNAVPIYAIPNLKISKRIVHDLPYRTSSLRALGGFVNVLAIETLMDEMAEATDADPVEFRLRHLTDDRARTVIAAAIESAGDPFKREPEESAGWGLGFARYKNSAAYCAVVARIAIDEAVSVTQVHVAVDSGEIINPDGAINQIEGGILQAISWTLKEAVRFDGRTVATQTWDDYPILRFSEVPEVSVRLIDKPDAPPLGCAEAAQGPTAAALANAVRRAIGVPVRDLPLSRDAIIAALS